METQQQQPQQKLARTSSSLLRTATVNSSIQSLAAVDELDPTPLDVDDNSKTHKPLPSSRPLFHPSSSRCLPSSSNPLLLPVTLLSISAFLFLLFLYLKDEVPISGNLLLCLPILLPAFLVAKRWRLCRSFLSSHPHHRGYSTRRSESVEWFIGDDEEEGAGRRSSSSNGGVREGVEFYSNGDCYEGELCKGRCNGSGVYSYHGNGRYEGDWVDGKYDGCGIESWARGSRYRGQYRQGLRHGFGSYRFYTGDSYSGQWFNGQSHGVGVQSCSDGSCYVGQFRFGAKHGLGYYHFRNGDRYSGEYFGDKIHGFGIYHFVNGHCYEGSWHEGRRQGFGAYTFRTGLIRSGEWDCGVLKTPHPPNSSPVQRAIQAARQAELNAVTLPRVDEQVEKAVAAANRAATAARVAAIRAVQNRIDGKVHCPDS